MWHSSLKAGVDPESLREKVPPEGEKQQASTTDICGLPYPLYGAGRTQQQQTLQKTGGTGDMKRKVSPKLQTGVEKWSVGTRGAH